VNVSAVTFDATHTLFHAPRMAAIYAEVLGRHGLPVDAATLRPLVREVWLEFSCNADPRRDRFAAHPGGAPGFWRRFLDRLCERLEVEPPSPFAARELYESFAGADAWEVYPDVVPALAELRARNVKLAVVSNWDERLPRLLASLGLAEFFDTLVYSQEAGVEKPNPAIFELALERLGVAPAGAVHVGDSAREDVEGAEAAGMRALRLERSRANAAAAPAALPSLAALGERLW
jgi:putative hydrolase of the HAD superfamily